MKRLNIVLFVVLLFTSTLVLAQTKTVLTGHDSDLSNELDSSELAAVSAVTIPKCKMPTKFLTLDIPAFVWSGKRDSIGQPIYRDTNWKIDQSWQYFGQSFIANGLFNIKTYEDTKAARVGYILVLANINESFANAFEYNENKNNITRKTIKTILKDKSYHEGIYQWLKPALILSWKTLKKGIQDFYRGLMAYIKTFNYSAEKNYYEKLKATHQEELFTQYEPNGSYDVRRKAKAWVFRRIYFDGWDFGYISKWINRIEKEIML